MSRCNATNLTLKCSLDVSMQFEKIPLQDIQLMEWNSPQYSQDGLEMTHTGRAQVSEATGLLKSRLVLGFRWNPAHYGVYDLRKSLFGRTRKPISFRERDFDSLFIRFGHQDDSHKSLQDSVTLRSTKSRKRNRNKPSAGTADDTCTVTTETASTPHEAQSSRAPKTTLSVPAGGNGSSSGRHSFNIQTNESKTAAETVAAADGDRFLEPTIVSSAPHPTDKLSKLTRWLTVHGLGDELSFERSSTCRLVEVYTEKTGAWIGRGVLDTVNSTLEFYAPKGTLGPGYNF